MKIFEEVGFKTKEVIIKEQHNCRATGYWKTASIKHNFLLIAHEFLFIFRKINSRHQLPPTHTLEPQRARD